MQMQKPQSQSPRTDEKLIYATPSRVCRASRMRLAIGGAIGFAELFHLPERIGKAELQSRGSTPSAPFTPSETSTPGWSIAWGRARPGQRKLLVLSAQLTDLSRPTFSSLRHSAQL